MKNDEYDSILYGEFLDISDIAQLSDFGES